MGSVVSEGCIMSRSLGPGRVSKLMFVEMFMFEILTALTVSKASFDTVFASSYSIVDWDVTWRLASVALLVRRRSPFKDLRDVTLDHCFFLAGLSFSDGVGMSM